MAIDTRSKRASVLGIGLAAALTLPLRDGTVGQADRQHVAFAYAGITAGESVAVNRPRELTTLFVGWQDELRDDTPGEDMNTLIVAGLTTARNADANPNDLNTTLMDYLDDRPA